jgi:hypothetical protein
LGSENYRQIKRHVALMSDHLHAQIEEISADEYIGASKFLKSLEYEARSAPATAMASAASGRFYSWGGPFGARQGRHR